MWRWDQAEPFGNNPANEDPDTNSVAFDLPLRLPGQYFDKETNLHYNYFRDYESGIGRYVQSDPIGLVGGLNTYLYGKGDPLRNIDPTGEFSLVGGAIAGGVIVGVMIYIQQQQGGAAGKKSNDPFAGPSGASTSSSSSSSSSGQALEECYAQCEEDQKERDALCYSYKYMRDKSKQAQCLRESFEKTVRCYTECRRTCK